MADSDLHSEGESLNAAKQAMKEKCEAAGGICWMTDELEIENYLPAEVISRGCKDLRGIEIDLVVGRHDRFQEVLDQGLRKSGAKPIDYGHNKLSFARKFAQHFSKGDINDRLREKLDEVVQRIKDWSS